MPDLKTFLFNRGRRYLSFHSFTVLTGNIHLQLQNPACQHHLCVSAHGGPTSHAVFQDPVKIKCVFTADVTPTIYLQISPSTVRPGDAHMGFSLQWKLLTGTQKNLFYIQSCLPKYLQYSGPALLVRHTCVLENVSLEITIYDPFVIVCLLLTKHRWEYKTRSTQLCFTGSESLF